MIFKQKNSLRLFSLAFACLIWLYVVSSAEIEVTKTIPLEVEVPSKYAIKNIWDRNVQYRIKGPGLFVRKFMEKEMFMKFATKDYYLPGKLNYKLVFDRSKIKLPLGVELIDIQPRLLNIALEKSMTKKIPIRLNIPENFKQNHQIDKISIQPKVVNVTGPKSLVRELNSVETEPIEKGKLNENLSFIASLKTGDQRLSFESELVNVSYTMEAKMKEFTFSEVPIIFQTVSLISQVEPKTVTVVVKGDNRVLERLSKERIRVVADVPAQAKGETEVDLVVQPVAGMNFEVIDIVPRQVKLVLE